MEINSLFIYFLILNIINGIKSTIVQPEINDGNAALMYLSRYGYVDHSATNREVGSLMGKEAVIQAIKDFQAFAGLNQTGNLDEETVEMMNTPRCGVVDKIGYGSTARRKKRYALQGSRWKVKDLTYKITKYPKLLTKRQADRDIDKAFEVWSDVTELTFTPVRSGKIHIEIRFEKGEHGDGDSFDGLGGTLAHAYFPIYGGDAHFDDSETWTIDSYRGTNLFQVAAHEFGHSLGLSHSDVQSALMAPFYRGYQSRFKLDKDDITAIQSLYGKKPTKAKKPTPTNKPNTPVSSDPVLCNGGTIDSILTMEDKMTYVFKGKYFWKLSDEGVSAGYPRRISSEFIGLPADIDAAFTWDNGKTYFFKGSKYWRFTGMKVDNNYPKEIDKGFSGIPDDVDAAFVWSGNGKIYFFKGTNYYKFDPTQRPPVSSKYPKDVDMWEGIPYYIDDAFKYSNGYTYFFKNGKYWRFNDRSFRVDSSDPPFPRLAGPWWFGCPNKGSQNTPEHSVHNTTKSTDELPRDYNYYADDADYHDYYESNLTPKYGYSIGDSGATGFSGHFSGFTGHLTMFLLPLALRTLCL